MDKKTVMRYFGMSEEEWNKYIKPLIKEESK